MQQEEARRIVTAQFYQSLNERGVQITAIPSDQLDAMLSALADSLFAVLDALESEGDTPTDTTDTTSTTGAAAAPAASDPEDRPHNPTPAPRAAAAGQEIYLWRGRPYLSIGTRYELTNQRLRIHRGILGNVIEEVELIRIRDTKVEQHAGERMLNVGDITIYSADPSTPDIVLHNVRRPVEVRETIRQAVIAERERRGMYYREDIGVGGN